MPTITKKNKHSNSPEVLLIYKSMKEKKCRNIIITTQKENNENL